jgi:ABC-2 type transport system ATP-binding protein
VTGFLGPNGAGKTTTMRAVFGLTALDAGAVRFDGQPIDMAVRRRFGYLPEERGLYRKMTVREHLIYLGELHGMPKRELGAKADAWLERLELADRSKSKVEELSKGMQQKIQLAGTLIHEPELLVLDEPFSGLDPINQGLFKDVLAAHKAAGKTLLFSTHVMEQAERLCDHIALVARGRIVLTGDLAELKRSRGANRYRLVADGDLAPVRAAAGVASVAESNGKVVVTAAPGVDGAQLLRELVSIVSVREFRSAEPTLEEIFVEAVRDAHV